MTSNRPNTSHSHRQRLAAGLITLALAVVAASCGGSDDSTATDSVGPSSTEASIVPTTTTTAPTTTTTGSTTTESTTTTTTVESTTTESTDAVAKAMVALTEDGLSVIDSDTGSATAVPFGTPLSATLAALGRAIGPPDSVSIGTAECSNGQSSVALWPELISLDFDEQDQFLSWSLQPGSALTTLTGFGLGSELADLDAGQSATVEESTLGTEFFVGTAGLGFGGLLSSNSPDATVDDLWAGPICAFR